MMFVRRVVLWALACAPWLLGESLARAEFVQLAYEGTEPSAFQLAKAARIPHSCANQLHESEKREYWRSSMECDFGTLSKREYAELMRTYSGWSAAKSAVPYSPGRKYRLTDFLPPLIQALLGHRFVSQEHSVDHRLPDLVNDELGDLSRAKLVTNCWGIAYEVLRQAEWGDAQPVQLFASPADRTLDILRANASARRTLSDDDVGDARRRNDGVRPGDVLLVYHTHGDAEWLDHVAIVIDHDLYFEKAGSGDQVPIRLVDYGRLSSIWRPGIFRYEILRMKADSSWPDPGAQFGLHSPWVLEQYPQYETMDEGVAAQLTLALDYSLDGKVASMMYLWIEELASLEWDPGGRAVLPQSAYDASLYFRTR